MRWLFWVWFGRQRFRNGERMPPGVCRTWGTAAFEVAKGSSFAVLSQAVHPSLSQSYLQNFHRHCQQIRFILRPRRSLPTTAGTPRIQSNNKKSTWGPQFRPFPFISKILDARTSHTPPLPAPLPLAPPPCPLCL